MKATDTAVLVGCCRWWALWRRFDAELAAGKGDPYKLTIQSCTAWKMFVGTASKLGLSPTDRVRLRVSAVVEPDEMSDLLAETESLPLHPRITG